MCFLIALILWFLPWSTTGLIPLNHFRGPLLVQSNIHASTIRSSSCTELKSKASDLVQDLRMATQRLDVFLNKTCSGYWTYGGCFEQHGEQIRPVSVDINSFSDALETHLKSLQEYLVPGAASKPFQALEILKTEARRSAEASRDRLEKAQEEAAKGNRSIAARLASEGGESLKTLTRILFQICSTTSEVVQSVKCEANP